MISRRGIALIASCSGLLAVILAAVGSHIVPQTDAGAQKLWATALQMHLFHTVAVLGVAALIQPGSPRLRPWSGVLMTAGVLFFSGSLYLRAGGMVSIPGPLAPLGGLLLMAGWLVFILSLIRKNPI